MNKGSTLPSFESTFLQAMAMMLRKRSKAIKHRTEAFFCEALKEDFGDTSIEKMELSFRLLGARPVRISCHLWADRWLWVDVRRSSKSGWAFEWQHEGRVGASGPKAVAESIESMFRIDYSENTSQVVEELERLWVKTAISGCMRSIQ